MFENLLWLPPEPFALEGLDANRVHPYLWQGSIPFDVDAVARVKFKLLLLCALGNEYRQFFGDDFLAHFHGVDVQHIPLDDAIPTEDELQRAREASKVVARAVAKGERTLITCMQGRNRSGLIVALALHRLTGASGAECLKRVQKHRKNALMNTDFVKYLETIPAR